MTDPKAFEQVAIVGMAGRFPGASDIDAFWSNLCDGVESIRPFSEVELAASGVSDALRSDADYVNAGAVMPDAAGFDAAFFGMSPREAELTDPQHRAFLECSWAALEHAGYDPMRIDGRVGVFGGVAANTYFQRNVLTNAALVERTGSYPLLIASEREYAITRVAYKLGLDGPAISINTACSTSAVAVHLAAQSLLSGESDLALAGGARIRIPLTGGYVYQEDGILSPDGHCRTFDMDARGTVPASGVAIVALKRLSDARRDGDTIYSVILGTAVNNDGAAKIGYTAPGVKGQVAVIREALSLADVHPSTIGMVEAHGTGTSLGDPIEVAALSEAFGVGSDDQPPRQYCAIGSLKTNIGHLDAAAGVAGIIKASLALHREAIPPSLNFQDPNPQIDFENSPFFVNTKLRPWKRGTEPRRAGISSFGLGGTNAHVVLEEGPVTRRAADGDGTPQVLTISAKTERALAHAGDALAARLSMEQPPLADVAFTLQEGRRPFEHRTSVVAGSVDEAIDALRSSNERRRSVAWHEDPRVAFLFPGGGSQHPDMAAHLYRHQPLFRNAFDRCAEALRASTGIDLPAIVYPPSGADSEAELRRVSIALPALFAVEYALAELWLGLGLKPDGMLGHSLGEYVAATVAGVFSPEDGIRVVAERGRLMQEAPAGAMLSVALAPDGLTPYLDERVSLAVVNAAESSVLSGEAAAIDSTRQRLESEGIGVTPIPISVASHSVLMQPVLEAYLAFLQDIPMKRPRIPFVSNVSGTWISDEDATDPAYWARHLRSTVQFADGVGALLSSGTDVLVEAGPGLTLTSLTRQHPAFGASHLVIPSLPHPRQDIPDDRFFLESVGTAWQAGVSIDWAPLRASSQSHRVALPTYPFERERHWIDPSRETVDPVAPSPAPIEEVAMQQPSDPVPAQVTDPQPREEAIADKIVSILADLSGMEESAIDRHASFLELGFDSLFLTQANSRLKKAFAVNITFRHLFEDAPNVGALAEYIDDSLPADALVEGTRPLASPVEDATAVLPATPQPGPASNGTDAANDTRIEGMVQQQLAAIELQIQALKAAIGPAAPAAPTAAPIPASRDRAAASSTAATAGALAVPAAVGTPSELTETQRSALDELVDRYCRRTRASKSWAESARESLADNWAVAGFDRINKEMTYQIVSERSNGAHIWDIDGNEYVDLAMSFGAALAGHSPDFIVEAVQEQMQRGFEVGVQNRLAGEVAERICAMTGNERATFAHSGSEAVEYAIRIARAVTARDRIVYFSGDVHGRSDIVLARTNLRDGEARTLPGTIGIPDHVAADAVVLDYGTQEALTWIAGHADELAAVLVEPVRTRNPDLQPAEFLRELRRICDESGAVLVFDEVVTGFRVHNGGAQAWFDIRADLVTYGKALAGGLPIGVVAGKREFLDAIDGGPWRFGDDSRPEVGVTVSGGTMTRHPLALAAAKAMLRHLEDGGGTPQDELAARTRALTDELNAYYRDHHIPIHIEQFSSFFMPRFTADRRFEGLFFAYLRDRGVHIKLAYPCFLSFAHSEKDVRSVRDAFIAAAEEMVAAGFLERSEPDGEGSPVGTAPAISPGASSTGAKSFPLTDAQRDIWLITQLGEQASAAYQISNKLRLTGDLDVGALHRSLQALVARHESLRIAFDASGDRQQVGSVWDIELPVTDLSGASEADRRRRAEEIYASELNAPFDLEAGRLFRARLVRLGSSDHVLVLSTHHLVSDGWSSGVLQQDLSALYSANIRGIPAQLGEVTQFSEYVEFDLERAADSERYWLEVYDAPPQPLDLPPDRPRLPIPTLECSQARTVIGEELLASLRQLAAKERVTLFTVLLAGWEILLHRLSGQDEFAVGLFMAGQTSMGVRDLAGACTNFVPLRCRFSPDEGLSEYLTRTKRDMYDAFDHQHCGIGRLVTSLKMPRDASRPTVVSTSITLESRIDGVEFEGLDVAPVPTEMDYSAFDLKAYLTESPRDLAIDFHFADALFEPGTIDRWLGHYTNLLREMTSADGASISRLRLLDDAERRQILTKWNDTSAPIPEEPTHRRFERQAASHPDRVAIRTSAASMTYAEVNRRANQLARHLRDLGMEAERVVGVHVSRTADMVVALLAVHKAGAAFVPLDPMFPAERLTTIAADSGLDVLLTHERLVGTIDVGEAPVVAIDREAPTLEGLDDSNLDIMRRSTDLAYVISTSGSTGRPKGVEVTDRALTNQLCSMLDQPGLVPDDVLLAVTAMSFDPALLELFLPLMVGAAIVIADEDEAVNAVWLRDRLGVGDITVMQATPATWQMLLDAEWAGTPGLKVLCGGEALSAELTAALRSRVGRLFNVYGTTETTIWSSSAPIDSDDGPIPIGDLIANTEFHVLDTSREPQPFGIVGELFIGGAGLARGYRGLPELTNERFVMHAFDDEAPRRLYRTGDVARRLAGGQIEFLGRNDFQVKIRGHRIELGEVEAVLARHPDVRECAVVARTDTNGSKRLVAYLVPTDGGAETVTVLRAYLREFLPEYMVPSQFMVLDAFPLSVNKKIDRSRLPDPDRSRPDVATKLVAPRTATEAQLARVWASILDVDEVGVHDNFFDLGGDSLTALRCVMQANRTGIRLAPISIFRHQTVAELAMAAEQEASSATDDQVVVTGPTPLTPAQLRFLTERESPDAHHWNLSTLVQAAQISPSALRAAVGSVLRHHDALRLRIWEAGGTWHQETAPPPDQLPLEVHDLSGQSSAEQVRAIERICTGLQASFDLAEGVLLRVALFERGPDEPDRLFVCIHHFAVDGLTWSVFWEDLEQAYRQAEAGTDVSLPPKTTSYMTWTTRLQESARTSQLAEAADDWIRMPWAEVARLPFDRESGPGSNTNQSAAVHELRFDADETRALLASPMRAEHVIMTSLARCLSSWTSSPTVLMDVLDHGRDATLDGVNLSRTVGFTLSYNPLVLTHPTWQGTMETLESVAQQVDDSPDGSSFELLRFLSPDQALRERLDGLPRADVLFNYAGSAAAATYRDHSLWEPAPEATGPGDSPRGLRQYPIAVRATLSPDLRIDFVYSTNLHDAATIEAKAAEVAATIRDLVQASPVMS